MSEFGSGLLYPIGLFLKHAERHYHAKDVPTKWPDGENGYWSMWWYGAADHLLDMRIPDSLPEAIRTKAKKLEGLALAYRLQMGETPSDNKERAAEAIELCQQILFEADKAIGVEPEKGDWQ